MPSNFKSLMYEVDEVIGTDPAKGDWSAERYKGLDIKTYTCVCNKIDTAKVQQ